MTKLKKLGIIAVSAVMCASSVFTIAGCGNPESNKPPQNPPESTTDPYADYDIPETLDFGEQVQGDDWELVTTTFNEYQDVKYYTVDKVIYCTNPTNPDEQSMRFYVPEAYLNADGTINRENEVNGYTADTAPIIYLNNCSGYNGGAPWTMDNRFRLAGVNTTYNTGWYLNYLENGFVLVFVGERGKSSYDSDGNVLGVAPVHLADLKAGVRFLKYNSGKFPGDTDKIISNGVSAGGNMSALLGVTGNSDAYDYYLKEMGAYTGNDADDSVFATQAYCPITDLDHAALAYEWMWFGGSSNAFQNALGNAMAVKYAEYINGLGLKDETGASLTLNTDGTRGGTFYQWLQTQYEESYTHYASLNGDEDSAKYDWLSYDVTNGASITSIQAMIDSGYNARQKAFGSFDPLNKTGDNAVFGIYGAKAESANSVKHFTYDMLEILDSLKTEYPADYQTYYDSYYPDVTDEEVMDRVALYNPYLFVTDDDTVKSDYFRICVGTQDRDTSPTISAVFALLLQNAGYPVDYNLIWNQPHLDADIAGEFEAWVNDICKPEN
ncbi:MAG: subtype B tannase [Candidatus Coproplasma sp.]